MNTSPKNSYYENIEDERSCDSVSLDYVINTHRTSSFFETFIHLFKSNIGVGILNIPLSFQRAGIIVAPIAMVIISIPVIYSMFLLLKCGLEIKRRYNKTRIGYAGTMKYSLIPYIGTKARYGVYLINLFIITSQLGFCSVYLVFLSDTLQQITLNYFKDIRMWIFILTGVIIIPVSLSNSRILSILSGFANIFCLFGLISTLAYIFPNVKSPSIYPWVGKLHDFPLFVSSIMYAFEGVNMVLPMENETKNPEKYSLVLALSTALSTFLYFAVGFFGYLAFGENLKGSITLNLPETWFFGTVKIIYALGVFLTFFIQFHVAMTTIIPHATKNITSNTKKIFAEIGIKTFFVVLTGLASALIPQLGNIISLIGALACSSLSLIFPCIIHIATFYKCDDPSKKISVFSIIKDIFIIVLGIWFCCSGLYSTITQIIIDYKKT